MASIFYLVNTATSNIQNLYGLEGQSINEHQQSIDDKGFDATFELHRTIEFTDEKKGKLLKRDDSTLEQAARGVYLGNSEKFKAMGVFKEIDVVPRLVQDAKKELSKFPNKTIDKKELKTTIMTLETRLATRYACKDYMRIFALWTIERSMIPDYQKRIQEFPIKIEPSRPHEEAFRHLERGRGIVHNNRRRFIYDCFTDLSDAPELEASISRWEPFYGEFLNIDYEMRKVSGESGQRKQNLVKSMLDHENEIFARGAIACWLDANANDFTRTRGFSNRLLAKVKVEKEDKEKREAERALKAEQATRDLLEGDLGASRKKGEPFQILKTEGQLEKQRIKKANQKKKKQELRQERAETSTGSSVAKESIMKSNQSQLERQGSTGSKRSNRSLSQSSSQNNDDNNKEGNTERFRQQQAPKQEIPAPRAREVGTSKDFLEKNKQNQLKGERTMLSNKLVLHSATQPQIQTSTSENKGQDTAFTLQDPRKVTQMPQLKNTFSTSSKKSRAQFQESNTELDMKNPLKDQDSPAQRKEREAREIASEQSEHPGLEKQTSVKSIGHKSNGSPQSKVLALGVKDKSLEGRLQDSTGKTNLLRLSPVSNQLVSSPMSQNDPLRKDQKVERKLAGKVVSEEALAIKSELDKTDFTKPLALMQKAKSIEQKTVHKNPGDVPIIPRLRLGSPNPTITRPSSIYEKAFEIWKNFVRDYSIERPLIMNKAKMKEEVKAVWGSSDPPSRRWVEEQLMMFYLDLRRKPVMEDGGKELARYLAIWAYGNIRFQS